VSVSTVLWTVRRRMPLPLPYRYCLADFCNRRISWTFLLTTILPSIKLAPGITPDGAGWQDGAAGRAPSVNYYSVPLLSLYWHYSMLCAAWRAPLSCLTPFTPLHLPAVPSN